MARVYSLAYLSSHRCTPPEAVRVAAANGYQFVGLRLWPNAAGAPQQFLLGKPEVLKETQAVMADTGVGIFDVEIIRIGEAFDPHTWDALYDTCAALKAKAILIAGDDPDEARLTQNYARLCEVMRPYGLTADLEFMPWTAVKDAKSALRIVQNAGSPANAGILVDALHFGRSTTTLDDIRAIPRELLHYAQICDAVPGTQPAAPPMMMMAAGQAGAPLPVEVQQSFEKLTGATLIEGYGLTETSPTGAICPVDNWFEWVDEGGPKKQPYLIRRRDGQPALCAGIGQYGAVPGEHDGFVILTADSEGGLVDVHDRRPVVLCPALARAWLAPATAPEQAEQMALNLGEPAPLFEWYPVSTAVGNVRHQGPDLVQRLG